MPPIEIDVNEIKDIPYVDGVMGNEGDGFINDGVMEANEGNGEGDGVGERDEAGEDDGEGDGEDDGADMEGKYVDDEGYVQLRMTRKPLESIILKSLKKMDGVPHLGI
ncbi:unnamed protein product [Lactuca saligna]|uniref:Uncharacterized protein n=1 Tax=Lactuca saligna TaxID=75948 RepID=A0AA35ZW57_LACSI|nr:unnamed protein product [Lactuca saligna]